MFPFLVRFTLTEPVILNPSIALDGMLAAAIYRRTRDPTTAHLHLPLTKHGDVYAASEIHFEAPVTVAMRPSREAASLRITSGRWRVARVW